MKNNNLKENSFQALVKIYSGGGEIESGYIQALEELGYLVHEVDGDDICVLITKETGEKLREKVLNIIKEYLGEEELVKDTFNLENPTTEFEVTFDDGGEQSYYLQVIPIIK